MLIKSESRMSKCKKVKNPCKICLGTVTQKTGLQCQGSCECWVHYACLNYTPGRIKDIKAGIIKITCPCPDCTSTLPKEFRTDEPFSCNNLKCPAKHPPNCGNTRCPVNKDALYKMNQTSAVNSPCPLNDCGTDCKKYSHPNTPNTPALPKKEPCANPNMPKQTQTPPAWQITNTQSAGGQAENCSSLQDIPGDHKHNMMNVMPSLGTLEQMCNTVGQLTNQINCLMNKMRQAVQDKNAKPCCNKKCCTSKDRSMCPQPCYCPGNPRKENDAFCKENDFS